MTRAARHADVLEMTPIGRLRMVGMAEGVSFIVLLFIATLGFISTGPGFTLFGGNPVPLPVRGYEIASRFGYRRNS